MYEVPCRCYPQFAVKQQGGEPKHCSMHNTARILAEGGSLVGQVLESDGTTRPISELEQQQLAAMREAWQQS